MGDEPRAHWLNVPGPFYVVDGCCTACGVPKATAPEMFAYDSSDHCFVRRQPLANDEVERALRVILGQELGCVRYRGVDQVILRRLAEAGQSASCDSPLTGIEPVLRNVVTFMMAGAGTISMGGFVAFVRGQLQGLELRTRVVPGQTLSLSWYDDKFYELALNVVDERSCRWMISHNGPLGLSDWLHQWLCEVPGTVEIRWFSEQDQASSRAGQDRPW